MRKYPAIYRAKEIRPPQRPRILHGLPNVALDFSVYDLFALGCALIWACNGLVLRTQLHRVAPSTINAIRCGIAGVFFWALLPFDAPLAGLAQVSAVQWSLFGVSLMLGIGLGDVLYLGAIKALGVSRSMALAGIFPLAAVCFEYLLLNQAISHWLLVGAGLVTIGVVFISLSQTAQPKDATASLKDLRPELAAAEIDNAPSQGTKDQLETSHSHLGILMALGAAVLWGLSTVLLKQAISHMTTIQANAMRMPLVTALLYLIWVRRLPTGGLTGLSRNTWLIVLGSGVIGMGVGSLMFLSALQYSSAARVVTLTATSPLFGMILAALFLKEEINRWVVLGMACCIAGVWCVL